MKATGIVRRIDDLGRVVIPKEIRKTLRIREGDPLEIFTDRDGEVILKKYSAIGELNNFATEYSESLSKSSGHMTCITDRDNVIAISGGSKKDYLEKNISQELESIIEERRQLMTKPFEGNNIPVFQGDDSSKYSSQLVVPVISNGDPIGSVIFMARDTDQPMGEVELKLAESAANFLGKQIEH